MPAIAPAAHDAAPTEPSRAPTGLLRATAVVATVAMAVVVLGIVMLLRPVETPLQDCGTALGFLLDGRVNEFADPRNPPDGLTAAEVTDNNTEPCRDRVADQARPAGLMVAGGLLVAAGAALVEIGLRSRFHVQAWRARHPSSR